MEMLTQTMTVHGYDSPPAQLCLNSGLDDVQLQYDKQAVQQPDLQQLVQVQNYAPVDAVVQEIEQDGGEHLAGDMNQPQTVGCNIMPLRVG